MTVARRASTVRRPPRPVRAMSRIHLRLNEARIIGCLMEKAVPTPDQCPLTLNALTTACNQKSSREPVLTLDRTTVERAARDLQEESLITRDENFRSGVVKYHQRLCNTMFSELTFAEDEYAVVCLLLLRGPQTPGELRARSGRLHVFADNEAVAETLQRLMDTDREDGAVVARLARVPGRRALVRPVGLTVFALELLVAFSFLANQLRVCGAVVAGILLVIFSAVILSARRRGIVAACMCFGPGEQPSTPKAFSRIAFLGVGVTIVVFDTLTGTGQGWLSWWTTVIGAACVVLNCAILAETPEVLAVAARRSHGLYLRGAQRDK